LFHVPSSIFHRRMSVAYTFVGVRPCRIKVPYLKPRITISLGLPKCPCRSRSDLLHYTLTGCTGWARRHQPAIGLLLPLIPRTSALYLSAQYSSFVDSFCCDQEMLTTSHTAWRWASVLISPRRVMARIDAYLLLDGNSKLQRTEIYSERDNPAR